MATAQLQTGGPNRQDTTMEYSGTNQTNATQNNDEPPSISWVSTFKGLALTPPCKRGRSPAGRGQSIMAPCPPVMDGAVHQSGHTTLEQLHSQSWACPPKSVHPSWLPPTPMPNILCHPHSPGLTWSPLTWRNTTQQTRRALGRAHTSTT